MLAIVLSAHKLTKIKNNRLFVRRMMHQMTQDKVTYIVIA